MKGAATASGTEGAAADRRRATLVGALAPLLWAALALLVTAAQPIPPFELVFLTFGVAFLLALGKWSVERALAAACALIVGGAALAAGGLFAKARN